MEFMAGVAVNLVAETATRTFDSFRNSEDKTMEYKDSLVNNINLARAITEELSDAQFTIKNKGLKKWCSDLKAAADEGEIALQSSTSDAKALKSAASKLENLTSKANTYLMLFESEKKAAALAACDILAALAAPPEKDAFTGMPKMPSFVALGGHRARNPNRHRAFDLCKSEKKALSSAAAAADDENPVLLQSFGSRSYISPTTRKRQTEYRMMSLAMTLSQSNKSLITGRSSVSKNRRRFVKDHMKALTCMGLYPESTGLPSDDSINTRIIYNGEHYINNHMNMKGKCPEFEFVKHTGYDDASMPVISCFPSSSCGGASSHISPSSDGIPEENHGHARDVYEKLLMYTRRKNE